MKLRWKIAQAAEIRWWQGYLNKKNKAEYLDWKKKYWATFLKDCQLKIPAQASCLDAGCGPAGIFTILEQQKVDAVDPLLDRYEKKLSHFKTIDYPTVNFIASPLEHFAPKQPYDYVFCLNAINHVSDLDQCWEQLFDATKKGGTLIVSIDAHNHSFFKHLFRAIPGDILHPHQYDLAEYETMLTNRGGKILKTIHKTKAFFFDYYVLVVEKT
ncbi:class I SAM-dependent methyltransferase [Aureispira anguillae]|uniref:Class I SAM-dependent methyltransferase n=1 Tax=Aureispira anguillae TaxID=2864201 RepID=A0A915YGE6_9BACT|nr:class I SAM-dependent methyltransferase [Aureispira anguillae]BDS12511.1 class I SAM-dependent methyltransferase [Aureispira anguillae]